jgi:hypothetical protein
VTDASTAASSVAQQAKSTTQSPWVKRLARVGLAARGLIYLLIGWLAWLAASGDPEDSSKDQQGAMQEIAQRDGGRAVLAVLAIGLAAYALWRLSEFVFGSADDDGVGRRLLSGCRAVAYGFLAFTAASFALTDSGSGSEGKQKEITARLMESTAGRWAIAAVGAVVIGVGVAFVVKGIRRTFMKHYGLSGARRTFVLVTGAVGNVARGLVFGFTGGLVIHAAWTYDAEDAGGLDSALQSLAQTSAGPALLYAAGAGLAVFGVYGLAEAAWRRL